MIRTLSRLLAVAAMAGAGTAVAADEDTMRLGRFRPDDAATVETKTLQTTAADDTALIHGYHGGGFHHGGYYGGGFHHGGYGYGRGYYGGYGYGRGYYGGGYGFGRSYYRGYGLGIGFGYGGYYGGYGRGYYGGFGRGYYGSYYGGYGSPYFSSYSTYYSMPVYYSSPCFSTGYYGAIPISGSSAATVPLTMPAQVRTFSEYLQETQPAPAATTPAPVPTPHAQPAPAELDGVRVSRPAPPSKYKYAAYGEKQ